MKSDFYPEELVKSKARFSFELEGKSYIDVNELSGVLNNTVDIVNQIVQGSQDTYVNLRITKFSTGSFDIDFEAVAEQVMNIITDPAAVAAGIVAAVSGVFRITKHLMGKEPKSFKVNGNHVNITNADGKSLIINKEISDKYFNNSKIEHAVINIINTVEKSEREGFNIETDNDVIKYNKDDFRQIRPVVENMIDNQERTHTNIIPTELFIRKPDLVGNSKWGFIFTTNIEATIEDEAFLEKVKMEKIRFGKGMRLPVLLKIETKLDKDGSPKPDPVYTVVKVTGDIIDEIEPQQTIIKQLID